MRKNLSIFAFSAFFVSLLSFVACQKEDFDLTSSVKFTRDTLRFDTVFVQRGSATRKFKILNNSAKALKISEIRLAGGKNSPYKINIDGRPTDIATDLEIAANDSMYIFVQVNIDPNAADKPFIVTDSILTTTNGVRQKVILEAFGQNAIYVGSRAGGAEITASQTWNSTKPYVVYGWLIIDSSATLTIPAGAHLYLHGGIVTKKGIFTDKDAYPYFDGMIYCNGNLKVMGTHSNPVFIQGDRLEHDKEETLEALDYTSIPGQWQGIIFAGGANSRSNEFNYCHLKNGVAGFYATTGSKVVLRNTLITNMIQSAFIGDNAEIDAANCLFSGSSGETINLVYGGTYTFNFCTIASYSRYRLPRDKKPVLQLKNSKCFAVDAAGTCTDKRTAPLNAIFENCIITGSLADELLLLKEAASPYNLSFKYCMLKRDKRTLEEATFPVLNSVYFNKERNNKLFKNSDKYDMHLDSLSVAREIGNFNTSFPLDLDDKPRKTTPAIGCYEYGY
jgi:hypothetical protein